MNSEYIEYCEDEVKMEIKSEVEDLEPSQNKNSTEYFEENGKENTVDEKNPNTNLVTYTCDICSKTYKFKRILKRHIASVHEKVKYPCNQCDKHFTQRGDVKRHVESVHE